VQIEHSFLEVKLNKKKGKSRFFRARKNTLFSISLDKDSISSSSSDEENEGDNEDSSLWQSVTDPSDSLIEEYSDDQRENIISIIQTVPFGGDLFNTVWPQWLSGRYRTFSIIGVVTFECRFRLFPTLILAWTTLKIFLVNLAQ